MKIACEKCGTVFEVDASQVPSTGLHMKCTSCFHSFTVPPATLDLPGAENNDFILSNNPEDFAAPSGYVDPTTKDITAYEATEGNEPIEIADLPGLPQRGAAPEITDLPGLPEKRSPAIVTAPPEAPPPRAPAEITDLPGLPQRGSAAEITDLPGLPRKRAAPEITDLPGLPQQGSPAEITDLPGLPSQGARGAEVTDLPGLPQQGLPPAAGQPADLTDLPGLPSQQMGGELPDLPGLPSGGAISDLPDLPTPSRPSPTPSASGMDYGEVSFDGGGDDAVSFDLDEIPVQTAGGAGEEPLDLAPPATSRNEMGAPDFDLPMPVRSGDADALEDLPAPSRPAGQQGAEEIISFEAPPTEEQAPAEPVSPGEVAAEVAPPEATTKPKGRSLPSKKVMIGAALGLVMLLGGGFLAMMLLGGGGSGSSSTKQLLADARRKLKLDNFSGYAQAARDLEQAGAKLEGAARTEALAMQAQALSARAHRFGSRGNIGEAQVILDKLGGEDEAPHVLKVANALLELAHGKKAKAGNELQALSDAKPNDAPAALYLGWAKLAQKQLVAADKAFRRASAADASFSGALFGIAQVAAAQPKKIKEALASCDKILAANRGHTGAILLKASLLVRQKSLDAALPLTQRVLKLARSGTASRPEIAEAHAIAAQVQLAKGNANQARAAFAKALKFDPRSREALMGSAQLALRANHFAQAGGFLRRAKAIDPGDIGITLLLAETMLSLGKPIDARDALKAALKAHPKNARVHFLMGRIEDKLEAHAKAIVAYKRAIKLDPKYFEPYRHLSRLHLRRKESSLAFGVLMQADTVLKNASVRNAIGEAHYTSGELKKARAKFEEALEMDAKLDIALFNLANTLRDQGQQKEALAKYQQLEERDRSFPGLAAAIGHLHMLMLQPEKAAQAYQQALKAGSPSVKIRLEAARAFVRAGKFEECFKQAVIVLRETPTSSEAHALRAEANLGKGKAQEALVEIRRAAERDNKPHYQAVMARAYEKLGKLGDAVVAYSAAIKLDPKMIDYRLQRARLQVRAGAVKDGLSALDKIIARSPKLAPAQLYRGIALIELGNEAQGHAALRAALSLDPKLGEAHFRLGMVLLDARKAAKAYAHLGVAVAQGKKGAPWLPDACFRYGKLAQERGAKPQAIDALKRFLEIAPARDANRPTATRLLAKLGVVVKPPEK